MEDIEIERRKDQKNVNEKVNIIWPWFNGNGNIGAKDRLNRLENIISGGEPCYAMKQLQEHMDWHREASGKRWEITLGLILIAATQIATIITVLLTRGG